MSLDNGHNHNPDGKSGCCGGAKAPPPTLADLERQLHALWTRVQEERARQAKAAEPAKKKGCCCG